jgi:hypothetical protein
MKSHQLSTSLNIPDQSNIVTDPARAAELIGEFRSKLEYLKHSYLVELSAKISRTSYNAALKRLKQAAARDQIPEDLVREFGPLFALVIQTEAQTLRKVSEGAGTNKTDDESPRQAAINVSKRAKALRGKPGKDVLRRNVEGLVALLQETCGRRVMAPREKDSVYEPHLAGTLGKVVRTVVDELAPGTTDSELSFWIREVPKKYAGKPFRFEDFYPGYRLSREGRVHYHHRDGTFIDATSI